jgi:hypothetical protein
MQPGRGWIVAVLGVVAVALGTLSPASAARMGRLYAPPFDPASFVGTVDNPYFPLTPGTTLVYQGETEDGFEHIEDYVTHDVKVILGVTCTVVRNRVWLDGELVEETFDWYAQDANGDVWYLGEDATEYENGVPVSKEGSWEAGVDGAEPGIIMRANPRVGDRYRQEYYEGVAEDQGRVLSVTRSACVSHGCFDNLLMTMDWTPLEPGFIEHKYYAWGIGLVLERALHGGQGRIELVAILTE